MAKNVFLVAGCPPPDLTTILTTATTKVDVRPTEERKGGAHHAPQCALAGSHLGMHPGRSHHGNKNQAAQGRLVAAAPRSDVGKSAQRHQGRFALKPDPAPGTPEPWRECHFFAHVGRQKKLRRP